jgi:cyclopropane fatty-acyl-phospholipid synthase-like methyltransferase
MPNQKDPERVEILHLEKAVTFAGRNVLEIGCGDGRLTWRYVLSAGRVTGVDPDGEAL